MNYVFIRRDACVWEWVKVHFQHLLKYTESNRYCRQYIELKCMEPRSRHVVIAANATLPAVWRNGLGEVVMSVVGENSGSLLWELYKADTGNVWHQCKHVTYSVNIVTTAFYVVNAPYNGLPSPANLPHRSCPDSVPRLSRSDRSYSSD
jgi:hypothetical protein